MDYYQRLKHILTEQEIKDLGYDIPYVPSTDKQLEIMMEFARIQPGMVTADLGAGDGRFVIAMAQRGAISHGYEIDESRVALAQKNIKRAGLEEQVFVYHKDFWDIEFKTFDVITIYGIGRIMRRLEEKLVSEVKPTCRIISNTFKLPHWPPTQEREKIYLYTVK